MPIKWKSGLLAVALSVTIALTAHAQNAPKHWVFFTDKGDISHLKPTDILSPKALERRAQQGIAIDYLDYPVNYQYITALKQHGIETHYTTRWFNGVSAELTPEQAAWVAQQPFVVAVQPMKATMQVAEATGPMQMGLTAAEYGTPGVNMLHVDKLHKQEVNGKGVLIAVLDDGFNSVKKINFFKGIITEKRVLATYDFVRDQKEVYDVGGHGTAVLSLIAAKSNNTKVLGTAPGASFLLFRTEDASSETPVEEDNWLAGAERADSLGADVIHSSLGYSKFDDEADNHTYAEMNGNTAICTRAADVAASKGILVVTSAGNEGDDDWKYITAPADGDSVLAVGAIRTDYKLASFSSVGPSSDGQTKPDLVALGEGIDVVRVSGSTENGSGTSYAGPLIAGFGACVRQSQPTAGAYNVYRAMCLSADRAHKPDNNYGYGLPCGPNAIGMLKQFVDQGKAAQGQKPDFAVDCFLNKAYADGIRVFVEESVKSNLKLIVSQNGKTVREEVLNFSTAKANGLGYKHLIFGTPEVGEYKVELQSGGKTVLSSTLTVVNQELKY